MTPATPMPPASHILNGAVSQDGRRASSPAPGNVAVDTRTVAQLLAFAANYGALINFYDFENTVSGDWAAFFAADASVALALHVALDLDDIERTLQQLLSEIRHIGGAVRRAGRLRQVLATVARLIAVLDRSHPHDDDAETFLKRQGERDGRLGYPLQRLRHHLGDDPLEHQLEREGWGHRLTDILDDLIVSLVGELRQGAVAAEAALDRSLASSGHSPQAALYNAFILLFSEARKELNDFPRRLVSFYYDDLLHQHDEPATPDQLFLTFIKGKAPGPAAVRRRTLFAGGTDASGAAINYATDTSLDVTPAIVTGLSIHRLVYDGDQVTDMSAVADMLSGVVGLDPAKPEAMQPFPVFGNPAVKSASLIMAPARLGFCVASPVLMLTGGLRTVKLGLSVALKGDPQKAALDLSGPNLANDAARMIWNSFDLHYSTAGGWVKVHGFDVTPSAATASNAMVFTFAFDLPADAPPLVAMDTKPNSDTPPPFLPASAFPDRPADPAIIATLKPRLVAEGSRVTGPMFAILGQVAIDTITIDVTVAQLPGLTLATPTGKVGNVQRFAPFGLPPVQYAALDIAAPELFVKNISTLSVAIDWAGLPVGSTGFTGYYQAYTLDADGAVARAPLFANDSFKIAFSTINPGLWDVTTVAQPLFQLAPTSDPPAPSLLAQTSALVVEMAAPPPRPAYYNPAASTLRLNLVEPAYAFGNILYSSNLMAAAATQSAAQAAAIAAASKPSGQPGAASGVAQIAELALVTAVAPEAAFVPTVAAAVASTLSALTGEALGWIRQAIGQSQAPAGDRADLLKSLEDTLADAGADARSWWQKLFGKPAAAGTASKIVDSVSTWVDDHAVLLAPSAAVPLGRSKVLLNAAQGIAASHAATAANPPAVARPALAATLQQTQAAMVKAALPNPPWVPMVSRLTLSYSASSRVSATSTPRPMVLAGTPTAPVTAPQPTFLNIGPFGKFQAPPEGAPATLLPAVNVHAALYIQLSAPVTQVSLLFSLSAGPDGWWDDRPTDRDYIAWEQYIGGAWISMTVLDDSTNQLANSGIVTLVPQMPLSAAKASRLRVRALTRTNNAPLIVAVTANAVAATWVGPGGTAGLGTPLPADTITKSLATLTNIGSIAQPMASFGGAPALSGEAFQGWMSERLRHKGFGITGWDHARLALAATPSLWQVAVVPATDEKTGERAPGKIWIIAVAGPLTPNVTDAATPYADLTTLGCVGALLRDRAGPFVTVAVTNPPYLRLCVTAEIVFSGSDTNAFWQELLNSDLKQWLSPWPALNLGERPADYYSHGAVSAFIRSRNYVQAITSLRINPETPAEPGRHYYLTSADQHRLTSPLPTAGGDVP